MNHFGDKVSFIGHAAKRQTLQAYTNVEPIFNEVDSREFPDTGKFHFNGWKGDPATTIILREAIG